MRNLLIFLFLLENLFLAVFFGYPLLNLRDSAVWRNKIVSPFGRLGLSIVPPQNVFEKYSLEKLKQWPYRASKIELREVLKEEVQFISYLFSFYSDGRLITGQANLPHTGGQPPVVLLFRGYVDKESYRTGDGTRRAAAYFANNGFATLAPDFLGYGGSGEASPDPLKSRFETYITAVNLIESVGSLPGVQADKIFLWGHSNGGQIALTVLEVTGRNYPTSLWAPVSKPFPYSVLFYSDEASDSGKRLRKVIADFEKDYEAEKYSLTAYLAQIAAPLQIHQGTGDEAVPAHWSRQLFKKLEDLGKTVEYFEYPGDDHNFAKGGWSTVVERDRRFFQSFL